MRAPRQREIKLRLVDLHRHAERLEAVDQLSRCAVAVVRMLAAYGENSVDQRPGVVGVALARQALSLSFSVVSPECRAVVRLEVS